jgi:squalene-hopene/tetraprenyl-beta-curcumene cyclase
LAYLIEHQAGGTWEEPEYTGTGFPRDFYINYHLYRHVFPVLTLAAFEAGGESAPTTRTAFSPAAPERVFSTA